MTEQDPLLTPAETGEHLNGIPVATLAQWRHRHAGPRFLKIGKHVRYRLSDVEKWLADQYGQGVA